MNSTTDRSLYELGTMTKIRTEGRNIVIDLRNKKDHECMIEITH